eukprot:1648472-Rhodomonas_salina.2
MQLVTARSAFASCSLTVLVHFGRLWKEEVALVRLQTATCDWITLEDYDETDEGAEIDEMEQARIADDPSKSQVVAVNDVKQTFSADEETLDVEESGQDGVQSRRWYDGWRDMLYFVNDMPYVTRYSTFTTKLPYEVMTPDEEFDLIAARNYVWNKAVKPMLLVVLSELVFLHCPRAVAAIQIMFHPLRVISVRLVCPGWASDSIWRCSYFTLKRRGTTNPMAGLIPRLMCHVLGDYYHRLRVEDKIRRFLRRVQVDPRSPYARATRSPVLT